MDEQTLIGALKMGSRWANELGSHLATSEDIGLWDDRKLAIGLIVYAASLAYTTELSEDEFMALTLGSYRGVELTTAKPSDKHHGKGAKN